MKSFAICILSILLLSNLCQAQITLSGTEYLQILTTSRPVSAGWTVRTGATASLLGTAAADNNRHKLGKYHRGV